MKELNTWAGKSKFRYTRSVRNGVVIEFGVNYQNKGKFTKKDLDKMLEKFRGKTIPLGTQHTDTPIVGSLAEWIRNNINKNRIMTSYLGPILVHEEYAKKLGSEIQFY